MMTHCGTARESTAADMAMTARHAIPTTRLQRSGNRPQPPTKSLERQQCSGVQAQQTARPVWRHHGQSLRNVAHTFCHIGSTHVY